MHTRVADDGWYRWKRVWAVASTAGVCVALLRWDASVVVVAFALGAVVTMVVHALHLPGTTEAPAHEGLAPACPDPSATVAAVVGSGVLGGLAVVALVTLGSLSGVLAASVLVAAVLSSPPAMARLRRRTGTSPSGTVEQVAHVAVATGGPAAADVVRALSDAQLCRAWRRSLIALRQSRSPEELEQVAVLRRACLDEMELRDPVAFASWLASGARAVGGPESFLGRGRRPESA